MATFSENQVRQLYVAKAYQASTLSAVGDLTAVGNANNAALYIKQLGAGGLVRSDLIPADDIVSVKHTAAEKLAYPLKRVKVTLSSDINSGAPVAGQDYLLRIIIKNYIGISDADQYLKYGLVHAISGMSASDFYKTLVLSLVKNFVKETPKMFKFSLEVGGTATTVGTLTEVTPLTKASALTGTYTGIVIDEIESDWILGVFQQTPTNFEVQTDEVVYEGDNVLWGTVTVETPASSVPDGKKIADLEYFLMGERGDQYRMTGFPNVIRTTYLVDPTLAYDTYDITYFYAGPNEDIQKSQKTITIVAPAAQVTATTAGINAALTAAGSSLKIA